MYNHKLMLPKEEQKLRKRNIKPFGKVNKNEKKQTGNLQLQRLIHK